MSSGAEARPQQRTEEGEKVDADLKIRVVLPQLQAGTCYVAGRSNVILS